jgi:hypothetical protein
MLLLLHVAGVAAASQRLAPALMQQPLLTARVCEACVCSSPGWLLPLLIAGSMSNNLIETEVREGQGAHRSSGPASDVIQLKAEAAAALAAEDGLQVQQQLWGLFMSCCKAEIAASPLAGSSTCPGGGSSADCHDYTSTLFLAAKALLYSAAQDSSSSSSSSSKKGKDKLCCWLVFAARHLRFVCKELAAAAAAEPARSDLQEGMAAAAAAAASPQQLEELPTATSAAEAAVLAAIAANPAHAAAASLLVHPGFPVLRVQQAADLIAQQLRCLIRLSSKQQSELSAAAAAGTIDSCAHLEGLLKQYGPVLGELERRMVEAWQAKHEPCRTRQEASQRASTALGPQLLQQVLHYAEGVCAALPLRHCCNNPGCLNLGGLSEAGLVAGAGSRCSRCRACYYCSRECQLAAWPLHKPVCKQLRAAEAAAVDTTAPAAAGTSR